MDHAGSRRFCPAPRLSRGCCGGSLARPLGRCAVEDEGEDGTGAVRAVLALDGAAMRFDDLARDGEAQARMVAEMLALGAVGVKALEDARDIAADARALVAHRDGDEPLAGGDRDGDCPALGRERYRI